MAFTDVGGRWTVGSSPGGDYLADSLFADVLSVKIIDSTFCERVEGEAAVGCPTK